MNTSLPPEQRDRPHLIKSIRKGMQRFQIAVYLTAIIGMAVLINTFMNGFGGGGSSDALISVDDPSGTVTIDQPTPIDNPKASTVPDVVNILIEEDRFQIAVGDIYENITLEEIAKRVLAAKGDSGGVKIIIRRKKSARELTHIELREELEKLNISKEAQRWPDKLVE